MRARSIELYGSAEAADGLDARPYLELVGRQSRGSILLLLGAGAAVLLVALANVTNLLLARGTGRTREMAVRASVGAHRGRLIRQLLVEGGTLGLVGGIVGLGATALTLRPVVGLARDLLPPDTVVTVDGRVMLAALAVAAVVGMSAALPPAIAARRSRHLGTLREGRGTAGRRSLLQSGLVVTQTGVAVVLLASSGLLLRSLWTLAGRDPGFDAEGVMTVRVSLLPELFGGVDDQNATVEAISARLASLPGVTAVGGITDLPLSGMINSTTVLRADRTDDPDRRVSTLVRGILPGFMAATGVDLEAGRGFQASDGVDAPPLAVVNRTYAARAFPGEDAIGRTVIVRGLERTIVGIAEDLHEFTLEEAGNAVLYEPYAQVRPEWMRTGVTLTVLAADSFDPGTLRSAIWQVDPRIPVGTPASFASYVDRSVAGHRFRAMIATAFGALALVLAAVGLAGVTAYNVGRRVRELGVRAALGASPGSLAQLVLRGSGLLTGLGLAAGVAGAIVTGQALAGFLFGVAPFDLATLAAATSALVVAAGLATLGPLRRAVSVDPVDALREE